MRWVLADRGGRFFKKLAPAALLRVVGGSGCGSRVVLGGVLVYGGGGLGANISDLRVEIQRGDAVDTMRAGELHATLDALDAIGFH